MSRTDKSAEKGTKARRKKLSIKSQLMLYLVAFVALVIGLLWLCQVVLLDDFYRYFKTQSVTSTGDLLAQNIENDDLDLLCEQVAQTREICVLVLDENMQRVVSREGTQLCVIHKLDDNALSFYCQQATESATPHVELFNMQMMRDDRYREKNFQGHVPPQAMNKAMSLLYARRLTLSDGTVRYLLLNAVISPLDATVSTLRTQLVFITGIVLVMALLLAALISRRFSRPIIATNEAAKALAKGKYDPPKRSRGYREIAELNDTLTQAAQELSQVEHLQHELIANISHDLRTPLTMIGGYAEVMRDIPTENTPENMQIIIDETSRLSSLVTEVLDFSKLQAGTLKMDKRPYGLTGSIRAILTRYNKLTEQDGYHIVFAPAEDCVVLADETRIGQVIYNLINNALTYTGADKTVTVGQEITGDMVKITVRDSGHGIPAAELPLIWNRYYRATENHKRAIQGSGLGLSIVRSILESHDAPYGVESEEGSGTCFWFQLALVKEAEDGR